MIRPSGSLLRGMLWVMVLVAATAVPVGAAVASGDDRAPSPTRSRPAIADWVWEGVVLDPPRRLGPRARHRVGQDLGRQVMDRLVGHGVLLRPWALEDLAVEIARRAAHHLVAEQEDDHGHRQIGPLWEELTAHVAEWVQRLDAGSGPVAADPDPSDPEVDPGPPPTPASTAADVPPDEAAGRGETDVDRAPPRSDDSAAGEPSLDAVPPSPTAGPREGATAPEAVPIAGRSVADVGARARPGVVFAAVRIGAQPLSLPAAAIGVFGLGLVATSRVGRPPEGAEGIGGRRGRGRPFR